MTIDQEARQLIAQHSHLRSHLVNRIKVERAILAQANAVNWDREAVIEAVLRGPSGWLGREVFETSYDNGSMKRGALVYDRAGELLSVPR